ncbi:MAG TPA: hypothetical protein VMV79_00875 [Alphaproteobacteria bacterium]|nr:hypothetical protein [Alphaproteobacteria bacterium]
MKRRFAAAVFAGLVAASLSSAARADVDYRCLDLCMKQGASSSSCLAECTYDKPPPLTDGVESDDMTAVPQQQATHDLVQAPVPAGNKIILPAPTAASAMTSAHPGIDYGCVNRCLHTGMQYDTCKGMCPEILPETTSPFAPPTNGIDTRALLGIRPTAPNTR